MVSMRMSGRPFSADIGLELSSSSRRVCFFVHRRVCLRRDCTTKVAPIGEKLAFRLSDSFSGF